MPKMYLRLNDKNNDSRSPNTLVAQIASNPEYGVDRVIEHDQIVRHGGNPDAAFMIDFKRGWCAATGVRGRVLRDTPATGTHGCLPNHPELRSWFMVMGKGVAHHKDLGVMDMRQIAPTVAEMLNVKLLAAKSPPVAYAR